MCFDSRPNGGDHDHRGVFRYLDAFAKGMHEELAAKQQIIVDEHSFHTAGKMAARTALERALDGRPAETSQ